MKLMACHRPLLIYDSVLQEFTFYSRKVGQEAGELWLVFRVHLDSTQVKQRHGIIILTSIIDLPCGCGDPHAIPGSVTLNSESRRENWLLSSFQVCQVGALYKQSAQCNWGL